MDPVALRRAVEARARELGFALVGVARATASSHRAALERWIADGKHGEMTWIAERAADAADVRRLVQNARSVICVADRYHDGAPDRVSGVRGRIARYARGKDYHDLIRDRLRKLGRHVRELAPGCQTRLTGDIHPILEREQAARALLAGTPHAAGMGWTSLLLLVSMVGNSWQCLRAHRLCRSSGGPMLESLYRGYRTAFVRDGCACVLIGLCWVGQGENPM